VEPPLPNVLALVPDAPPDIDLQTCFDVSLGRSFALWLGMGGGQWPWMQPQDEREHGGILAAVGAISTVPSSRCVTQTYSSRRR
jgi:hypothetical protein